MMQHCSCLVLLHRTVLIVAAPSQHWVEVLSLHISRNPWCLLTPASKMLLCRPSLACLCYSLHQLLEHLCTCPNERMLSRKSLTQTACTAHATHVALSRPRCQQLLEIATPLVSPRLVKEADIVKGCSVVLCLSASAIANEEGLEHCHFTVINMDMDLFGY